MTAAPPPQPGPSREPSLDLDRDPNPRSGSGSDLDLTAPPAQPHAGLKARLAAAVVAAGPQLIDLSHALHADPEPAFEEHRAAQRVAAAVAAAGYQVEHPAGRLPTAVRATLDGGLGTDGPTIGILAEYDALPGLGHGCGHNTMAASGVGAALALAAVAADLRGRIVLLGTPAEERGSGKQMMLDDGLFDGLDAALLFHPGDRTQVACALLASEDIDVTFTGLAAHAAGEPWMGRNALDALILLFTSVGLWRQQLRPDARVHGIVLEGGTAANIIPERAVARFMIRSIEDEPFAAMGAHFDELVEAAALASGTHGQAVHSGRSDTMHDNATLAARFRANLAAYGVADEPVDLEHLGSSDMGNVSHVLPTIHPTIAICPEGVPGHSVAFREAAAAPRADAVTLLAATVVGQTAIDLLAEPDLVAAAWQDFRAR
ncbi:MAG TPA: amidohydrolase [Candidatus Limnocylindrales bacterium]|nr:amidohydrolase [Candidatus Limnocylindrales bacterium]